MTRQRREPAAAVAGCAVAGALALSAGGQTWAEATVGRQPPLPPVTEALSGGELAALVPACGLLLLAAAVAVVAVRGRVRQVVGLVAAVGGGALLWSGLRGLLTDPGLADLSDGTAAGATAVAVSRSAAWPGITAAAGVLAVAAGVLAVLRGRGWTGMGRRYERAPAAPQTVTPTATPTMTPAATPTSPPAATPTSLPGAGRTREDRALDAWRALDRGEDPTAGDEAPADRPPGGTPAAAGEEPAR